MTHEVPEGLYYKILRKLDDIKHQLEQKGGCLHDPNAIHTALELIVNGDFERFMKIEEQIDGRTFPLEVDFDMPVSELIMLGRYDWCGPNVIHYLPREQRRGKANVVVELMRFSYKIENNKVLCCMDKMGFRPATIHELLFLGIKFPQLQYDFPIIALGSIWEGPNRALFGQILDSGGKSGKKRTLDSVYIGKKWHEMCRFAVVRK